MNDTVVTVVGNVVDQPRMRRTKNGTTVTSFRVASTSRRFDREQGQWQDNDTLFVSVSAWRALGENVAGCVQKGQPVIVNGRFAMHEYEVDGARRHSYEIDATAVGHDLGRGTSQFERTQRSAGSPAAIPDSASGAGAGAGPDHTPSDGSGPDR